MGELHKNIVLEIIHQQENMVGPLAWEEARRVRGLTCLAGLPAGGMAGMVVSNHTVEFAAGHNPADVIGSLVLRYERLYGAASRVATRRAVVLLLTLFPDDRSIQNYIANDKIICWNNLQVVQQLVESEFIADTINFLDGMILEISQIDNEIYSILAQAIISQTPTLCLYKKEQPPKKFLESFAKAGAAKNIVVKSYTEKTIADHIAQFSKSFGNEATDNIPAIKYTLRLTPKLDRYLNWLAHGENLNKAEYMRKLLDSKLAEDGTYLSEHQE